MSEMGPSTPRDGLSIAVLGLGHVGLPTALGLAEVGWTVLGADHDLAKAAQIGAGETPFHEPGMAELLAKHLDTGRFAVEPAPDDAIRKANVLFVCVGTPQKEDGSADLMYLDQVTRAIASNLNGYKLIVEKSTAPVLTAQRIGESIGRYSRREGGSSEFDVAVNPEFLREGTAIEDSLGPDRIVLGVGSARARDILLAIYQPLLDRMGATVESRVLVTSVATAEIIKHASNAFLAARISMINMVADLCDATGADIGDVARGVGMDRRMGPHMLNAGIGFGGSCFPKDIRAFSWIASKHGVDFSILREIEKVNRRRVEMFMSKVENSLWVIQDKTVAVWGLSFKPGTDDIRDAPSLAIVRRLLEEGGRLRLYDPVATAEFRREFPQDPPRLTYCETPMEAAGGADALLVLTEWSEFADLDLDEIRQIMASPLILDGRNLFDPSVARDAGFEYVSVGRP